MFPPSLATVSSLSPDVAVGEVGRWTLVLLDLFAFATQDSHYDPPLIMSVLLPIGTLTEAEVSGPDGQIAVFRRRLSVIFLSDPV